jgi:hypothetical protein
VQVTSKAFKFYTNRSKAITAWNKPLLAIPVEAIKSIERAEIDLYLTPKDQEKFKTYIENQFIIHLKKDFI